jgi:outer membrane protein OmpA-like peptidoglycan-associated protein
MQQKLPHFLFIFLFFFSISACQNAQQAAKNELLSKTIKSADLLLASVQELKIQIGKRIGKDSNDVSKVFLPILSKIEAKSIQSKAIISQLDLSKTKDLILLGNLQQETGYAIRQTQAISTSLDQVLTMVLSSDISFETGKYYLNVKGADVIENYANVDIKRLINFYDQNPDYKQAVKIVKISISGYADATGSKNIEKRIQSNLLLSQKRADAVKSHLDFAFGNLRKKYKMGTEIESIGFGEALPMSVSDNVAVDSPQRRICKISGLVYPDFQTVGLVAKK